MREQEKLGKIGKGKQEKRTDGKLGEVSGSDGRGYKVRGNEER